MISMKCTERKKCVCMLGPLANPGSAPSQSPALFLFISHAGSARHCLGVPSRALAADCVAPRPSPRAIRSLHWPTCRLSKPPPVKCICLGCSSPVLLFEVDLSDRASDGCLNKRSVSKIGCSYLALFA
jgi:hypothetical protein